MYIKKKFNKNVSILFKKNYAESFENFSTFIYNKPQRKKSVSQA